MNCSIQHCCLTYLLSQISITFAYQPNSKFLNSQDYLDERRLNKRRRPNSQGTSPCSFGGYGKPKNQPVGRTFFDLQFLNVEHNYNLEINCGGVPGSYPSYPVPEVGGGHKPLGHKPIGSLHGGEGGGGGGHKPHKPFQGFNKPSGGGGLLQGLFGGGGGGNKPLDPSGSPGVQGTKPGEGVFSGAFAGILPSPTQFATGLSEGLQGFIGTLPAIGQSFQYILPSFSDIQWPQFLQFNRPGGGSGSPVPINSFNGPPSFTAPTTIGPIIATTQAFVTPAPITTTTDPDDIIYSDEIKPVNEDYDLITDPYNTRPAGPEGKYRPNRYYSKINRNYYRPSSEEIDGRNGNYQRSEYSDQFVERSKERNFRFPS